MATPVDQSDQNLSSMNRLSSAPTSVPDTKAAPEISDLYKNCLNAYEKTQDALLSSTHDHATENKFDRDGLIVSLQESRSKFKAWAQNIAAFQSSKLRTSLDYRLKEAAGIRERIVTILQELLDSLSEALPIISGDEPNDTWKVGSFSDSESDDETNSQASEEVVRTSELDELFSAIHNSNVHLMKLSMVIRSSPARDDYLKAASRYQFDPRYDIGHVKEKHGKLDRCPDWLVERLGKAITRRRQYLKYREDHHGKLSKDWEEVPKEVPVITDFRPDPTIVASTKATTFIQTRIVTERPPEDDTGSLGSMTSYEVTTMGDKNTHYNLTVPHHPTLAFEGVPFDFGEPFQCPYCYTEQVVKNRAAWKKHVFRDLKPYVCTFKECNLRMFRKRAEWFFHEIQNHRRQWTCEHCEQTPCTTKNEFIKHVSSKHGINYTGSQLEALIYQSEEPIDKFSGSACRLCDEWGENMQGPEKDSKRLFLHDGRTVEPYGTLRQFRRHLGRHMEQLALFALPKNDGDEMEDQSSGEEEDDVESKSASAGTATLEAKVTEDWAPPSDDRTRLANLLQAMQKHPSSWPFLSPISKDEVPDYYDVIQEPMDLGIMEKRLAAKNYATPEPFFRDAMLIFDNCRKHNNETTPYAKSANKLEKYMWAQVREVLDWSHLEPRYMKTSSGEQGAGIPVLRETSRGRMREFIRNTNIEDQHLIELDHKRMNLSNEISELEMSLMTGVLGGRSSMGVEEYIPQKKAELEVATAEYDVYLDKLYQESKLKETVELEEVESREGGAAETSLYPDISPQEDEKKPIRYPDISSDDEKAGSGQYPDISPYDKQAEDITGVYGTPLKDSSVVPENVVGLVGDNGGVVSSKSATDSLASAALKGHEHIAKLPLEYGAINQGSEIYGNALEAAAFQGHENMVKLLLKNGANINQVDGSYGSALKAAASQGHEHVVKLLLEYGAINQGSEIYGNALEAAAFQGHENMVKLLLENGANINQGGGIYGNALEAASARGHQHVVKLLLENGADVMAAGLAKGELDNAEVELERAAEGPTIEEVLAFPPRSPIDSSSPRFPKSSVTDSSLQEIEQYELAGSPAPTSSTISSPNSAVDLEPEQNYNDDSIEDASSEEGEAFRTRSPRLAAENASFTKEDSDEEYLPFQQESSAVPGSSQQTPLKHKIEKIQTHVQEPIPCPHCARFFSRGPDLVRHARRAHREQTDACPECGYVLITQEALRLHLRKEHAIVYLDENARERMFPEANQNSPETADHSITEKTPQDISEQMKKIRFEDAVGRKFSFPFHLCRTWAGMEELINQAFLHMEVIGPHVLEGHYDLIGPSGEIILPQVWERTVEPDLVITMRIWHNVIGESKDPEWASVLF